MGVEHRLSLKCDICHKGTVILFEEEIAPSHSVNLLWYLPQTWSYVRGQLICEDHEVRIEEKA